MTMEADKDGIPKYLKVKKQTLHRDDLIEWILRNVGEEWECRIYETKHHVLVGIDKEEKVEE